MVHFTRREFLKTGLADGTLAVSGAVRSAFSARARPMLGIALKGIPRESARR